MTFLPIVARELRVAARRAGTYWSRLLVALIAMSFFGASEALPGLAGIYLLVGAIVLACAAIRVPTAVKPTAARIARESTRRSALDTQFVPAAPQALAR